MNPMLWIISDCDHSNSWVDTAFEGDLREISVQGTTSAGAPPVNVFTRAWLMSQKGELDARQHQTALKALGGVDCVPRCFALPGFSLPVWGRPRFADVMARMVHARYSDRHKMSVKRPVGWEVNISEKGFVQDCSVRDHRLNLMQIQLIGSRKGPPHDQSRLQNKVQESLNDLEAVRCAYASVHSRPKKQSLNNVNLLTASNNQASWEKLHFVHDSLKAYLFNPIVSCTALRCLWALTYDEEVRHELLGPQVIECVLKVADVNISDATLCLYCTGVLSRCSWNTKLWRNRTPLLFLRNYYLRNTAATVDRNLTADLNAVLRRLSRATSAGSLEEDSNISEAPGQSQVEDVPRASGSTLLNRVWNLIIEFLVLHPDDEELVRLAGVCISALVMEKTGNGFQIFPLLCDLCEVYVKSVSTLYSLLGAVLQLISQRIPESGEDCLRVMALFMQAMENHPKDIPIHRQCALGLLKMTMSPRAREIFSTTPTIINLWLSLLHNALAEFVDRDPYVCWQFLSCLKNLLAPVLSTPQGKQGKGQMNNTSNAAINLLASTNDQPTAAQVHSQTTQIKQLLFLHPNLKDIYTNAVRFVQDERTEEALKPQVKQLLELIQSEKGLMRQLLLSERMSGKS